MAECRNRTLVEKMRSMLISSKTLRYLYNEALNTTN
jgi:hypothetical protein